MAGGRRTRRPSRSVFSERSREPAFSELRRPPGLCFLPAPDPRLTQRRVTDSHSRGAIQQPLGLGCRSGLLDHLAL